MARELTCFVMIPSGERGPLGFVKDERHGLALVPSGCKGSTKPELEIDFDNIFKYIIREAVERINQSNLGVNIRCVRGEDLKQPGDIISHTMGYVCRADITITDVTGNNPNVFLEYGIRLSVRDSYNILICHEASKLPFDIEHIRAIRYSTDLGKADEARSRLHDFLKEFIEGRSGPDRSRYYDYVELYTSRLLERKLAEAAGAAPKLVADLAGEILANPATSREYRKRIFEYLGKMESVLRGTPGDRGRVIEHLELIAGIKGIDKSRLRDTYYELAEICDADDKLKDRGRQYLAQARELED